MVNPTSYPDSMNSDFVCIAGQPCVIKWSAASTCDAITFDLGYCHWLQPGAVVNDGVHLTEISSGVRCSSRIARSSYPLMSTCIYTWTPPADALGFLTLVVSVTYGSASNSRTDRMYGYLEVAARKDVTQHFYWGPATFLQAFLPVLDGQLTITSSAYSLKDLLHRAWAGAKDVDPPERWAPGEQRTVSFYLSYTIATSPIRADFYDTDTIEYSTGEYRQFLLNVVGLVDKLQPAATVDAGTTFELPVNPDPAYPPDRADNPVQPAKSTSGSFSFAVPSMLPGTNRYWLTLRSPSSADMLLVESTTPVAPTGSMVQYLSPGVAYSGQTDPTAVNFGSRRFECVESSAAYPVTLRFSAGPAPSTIVTLTVGSALTFSCMLQSADQAGPDCETDSLIPSRLAVLTCVPDAVAGETPKAGSPARQSVLLWLQLLDSRQQSVRLTLTTEDFESSRCRPRQAACRGVPSVWPPRCPALLRDQPAARRLGEDPLAAWSETVPYILLSPSDSPSFLPSPFTGVFTAVATLTRLRAGAAVSNAPTVYSPPAKSVAPKSTWSWPWSSSSTHAASAASRPAPSLLGVLPPLLLALIIIRPRLRRL